MTVAEFPCIQRLTFIRSVRVEVVPSSRPEQRSI
jgi:hypothetical protein